MSRFVSPRLPKSESPPLPTLHAVDVGHRFPGRPWLFRNLTARLKGGSVYAVTGPSGTGKSTLLGIFAGWVTPTEGICRESGDMTVAWVFQQGHGTSRRSALDHVALPFLAQSLPVSLAEQRAKELLDRFGLSDVSSQEFRRLSGGEVQRLMLARALASSPSLLLIDEPTAQLDHGTAREVDRAILQLRSQKTIVVVATHDAQTRDSCTEHIDLADFQNFGVGE